MAVARAPLSTAASTDATRTAPDPPGWSSVALADLAAVDDLLDSLENHGVAEREVAADGNARFVVRWR